MCFKLGSDECAQLKCSKFVITNGCKCRENVQQTVITFTRQTNKAITNSHPNVNSELLCNVKKTNLLSHRCCSHIRCMFVAGPNKRVFAAITFVAATFVPRSSCVHSSEPSFGQFIDSVATFLTLFSLDRYN